MIDPAAIRGLPELLSARVRGCARAEEYVAVAQNALEAGFDTPSTLSLAIEEPPFFTPSLDRCLGKMLSECKIQEPTADQALIQHARIVAAKIVAGSVAPTAGAEKIAEIFTLDHTPDGFRAWTIIGKDCGASTAASQPRRVTSRLNQRFARRRKVFSVSPSNCRVQRTWTAALMHSRFRSLRVAVHAADA